MISCNILKNCSVIINYHFIPSFIQNSNSKFIYKWKNENIRKYLLLIKI